MTAAKAPTPKRVLLAKWLAQHVPLLDHVKNQALAELLGDVVAGSITAILIIPQAIAYALLAGLPPQMGLYAAIIAPVVYAITGSSRATIIGPAAVTSAMVATALVPLASGGPAAQVAGAVLIGIISGTVLLLMGLIRMGWLTHFISNPVLSGFTTGAVIYIVIGQFATLLGIHAPKNVLPLDTLRSLIHAISTINPITAACGVGAVILLLLAKGCSAKLGKMLGFSENVGTQLGRIAPLFVVLIFTVLSSVYSLSIAHSVDVVGEIPRGLPQFSLKMPADVDWRPLLPDAVLIAIIGYIETLSVAKALAFRRRERISPDRELVSLGLTNIAIAACGGMPVAGSFSKSMVNFESGARTQLSGLVAAVWVAICAIFVTGLLQQLPRAVLAAIIIVAVLRLIDFKSALTTWRYDRGDGLAQIATIIGVLALGIDLGLLAGSFLALALFLYRTSRPHILVVGHVPGTQHFRSIKRNDVVTFDHLLLIRIDENLYFANTPRVETELQRLVAEYPNAVDVVLILSGIGYIDASSLDMLDNFERELSRAGCRLHLSEFKSQVIDRLRPTEFFQRLFPERIHRSTFELVASFDAGMF